MPQPRKFSQASPLTPNFGVSTLYSKKTSDPGTRAWTLVFALPGTAHPVACSHLLNGLVIPFGHHKVPHGSTYGMPGSVPDAKNTGGKITDFNITTSSEGPTTAQQDRPWMSSSQKLCGEGEPARGSRESTFIPQTQEAAPSKHSARGFGETQSPTLKEKANFCHQ